MTHSTARPTSRTLCRLVGALVAALMIAMSLLGSERASADTFLPPAGKAFTGLTGSQSVTLFSKQVGKRPAVFGHFVTWGSTYEYAFRAANSAHARLMLHISTAAGYGQPERITPLGIARGDGDSYLIGLTQRIAEQDTPTYVRLMSEMNQTNNAYSAFDRSGRSRGASHSTAAFRQAWRRAALILRGGPLAQINAKLVAMNLPKIRDAFSDDDPLPRPRLAMVWVPQTRGSPDIPANLPEHYWPGAQYVDWVGTDFYSKFPRFDWLEVFYRRYHAKPFVLGEWAVWGRDDPAFVRRLFRWMKAHPRLRMWLYNQGNNPVGPFRLKKYPNARRVFKSELRSSRWVGGTLAAQTTNQPLFGVQVKVAVLEGVVLVRKPGERIAKPLTGSDAIPLGSIVDVTAGRIRLSAARPNGKTESVEVYGGVFKTRQRDRATRVMELVLQGAGFSDCPAAAAAASGKKKKRRETVRSLWVKGRGRFRTNGKYGTATVRGTWWLTEDRCDGTRVKVQQGTVAVRDFHRHKTVIVRTGGAYVARRPG